MRYLPNTLLLVAVWAAAASVRAGDASAAPDDPRFSRHVVAVFSRLGCNGGTCHGAVQGKNGFRLTLFGTRPDFDYPQVARDQAARRINPVAPEHSLLLLKPTARVAHGGGKLLEPGSHEYELLREWIARGAALDKIEDSRLVKLTVTPAEHTLPPGQSYQLTVEAEFADGSREDVTRLCAFDTLDDQVATVDAAGKVTAVGVGDTPLRIRYRDEPITAIALVPRPSSEPFPAAKPHNFIDEHILAKLRRLNVPPSPLADDATFLRRARLDVTGKLPAPEEVRAFLADKDPNKRQKKIDELLADEGHSALWALKFCDILGATEFGVYADGMQEEQDAPRFLAWVRARLQENTPYGEFAARILLATSRDGRSLEDWAAATEKMQQGYRANRTDTELYQQRKTLDLFWQRKAMNGVPITLQVSHAFFGLRLECAQCHRHPHDVWQQDDLLSFANFFTRVRKIGFNGQNEKNYPEVGAVFKRYNEEGKQLQEEAKKQKEGPLKQLREEAQKAKKQADQIRREIDKLNKEAEGQLAQAKQKRDEAGKLADDEAADAQKLTQAADELERQAADARKKLAEQQQQLPELDAQQAEFEKLESEVRAKEQRGKLLPELAKRLLHAEVHHVPNDKLVASVTSPLGTQTSKEFRLLGQSEPLNIPVEQDPRQAVVDWMRQKDNPFFAKAIVNRVWAHYFGRGIIDPPDNLSAFNPASHPELLDQLCRDFISHGYDLRWLHRTILASRTYQQASDPLPANAVDRTNYAYFSYRRLPAEVLLDALNQATGTRENMDMKYHHWPEQMSTVEIPFLPRNEFVKFVLEQFGKPTRNSAVQCDCQRNGNPSVLQVLTLANHPHVWEKINDAGGLVAQIGKQSKDPAAQIEHLYLATVSRLPSEEERRACAAYLQASESPAAGLAGVMWSLLNTREFLLQH